MNHVRKNISVISSSTTPVSPWVSLVAKTIADEHGVSLGEYHSIAVADYVSILAVTRDGTIPLVRQFRPAVERMTLEFPGGLLDPGEQPGACAARELSEEAGLVARDLQQIGYLMPDSGRLGNRLWCFFSDNITADETWVPEADVELFFASAAEIERMICTGEFDHAPHVAIFGLARAKRLI